MAKTTLKSKATLINNVQVEVEARGHKVTIDEPERAGGTDLGMNPLELLLSSLGACQTIMAQSYADKMGIQYDRLVIELEGDLDTGGYKGKPGAKVGLEEIRYFVHMESNAPQEKIEEFIRYIEAHCPALDTLINPTKVVSKGVKVTQTK
ncbi:OsmC family protein [Pradoshia sp. D12]|uniref:OsmC family protein n=1 Tax=Bacillaceae TaxID=186817 RepID=UPI00080AC637|nr:MULTISPECIES: OsmC family protein [Bacillaceae]OCA86795.1 peroxiredoxin [Bacillus sp. FJAT-27986]QFK71436.1 OsmC family protein [Pradoshia sp. D12]TPF73231.1 OsmC family protein [Bacillus sp. D12]